MPASDSGEVSPDQSTKPQESNSAETVEVSAVPFKDSRKPAYLPTWQVRSLIAVVLGSDLDLADPMSERNFAKSRVPTGQAGRRLSPIEESMS